jgi:hypothetical protein
VSPVHGENLNPPFPPLPSPFGLWSTKYPAGQSALKTVVGNDDDAELGRPVVNQTKEVRRAS